jgi:hypothetical protein
MNPTAEITARITAFLHEIGIPSRATELNGPTVLPGIRIERGAILYDEAQLLYPGDLLHEAGHLAMMTPEDRQAANADTGDDGGFEMAAIAWSYAAALHIGIDPAIVFHPHGYFGGSQSILTNFSQGNFFGVPILQWLNMTVEPGKRGPHDPEHFPHMKKWLRE